MVDCGICLAYRLFVDGISTLEPVKDELETVSVQMYSQDSCFNSWAWSLVFIDTLNSDSHSSTFFFHKSISHAHASNSQGNCAWLKPRGRQDLDRGHPPPWGDHPPCGVRGPDWQYLQVFSKLSFPLPVIKMWVDSIIGFIYGCALRRLFTISSLACWCWRRMLLPILHVAEWCSK